jgi:hypothetical protein
VRTRATIDEQSTRSWSELMSQTARGHATAQQLLALTQAHTQTLSAVQGPALASSAFMAAAALASEAHRFTTGRPCEPAAADLAPHLLPVPFHDQRVAGAFVRGFFRVYLNGDLPNAGRLADLYAHMSAAQRIAATATLAGYAGAQAARLSALARTALAMGYAYAPTPTGEFGHVFAALLADTVTSGQQARTDAIAAQVRQCVGPVFEDIIWVCLRTAAVFVTPGAPMPVPRPQGCTCDNGEQVATLLSPWAAQIAAGKANMREVLHLEFPGYARRDSDVAHHMLESAVELLAATTRHEMS